MFTFFEVDMDRVKDMSAKTLEWDKALGVHAEQCKQWISLKKGLVN